MLRVGIVGLGGVGQLQADIFASEPRAQLAAVCDRHPDRGAGLAARYRCQAYTDVASMLAAEHLDLVSVCTAGHERGADHYRPTLLALEAGAHVLVEKPISNSLHEAIDMVAQADRLGRRLAVNLNHRFSPALRRARQLIAENQLGSVLLAHAHLWVQNPADDTPFYHLIELHSHSLDLLRYLCGDIEEVHAFLTRPQGRQCWSNCSLNLRFASGAIGSLLGSYDMTTAHPFERCEVAGDRGHLVIDDVYDVLSFYDHTRPEATVWKNSVLGGVNGFYDTFRYRIRALLEDLESGRPVEASGHDGLAALRVIHAAIRSFEDGRPVRPDAI